MASAPAPGHPPRRAPRRPRTRRGTEGRHGARATRARPDPAALLQSSRTAVQPPAPRPTRPLRLRPRLHARWTGRTSVDGRAPRPPCPACWAGATGAPPAASRSPPPSGSAGPWTTQGPHTHAHTCGHIARAQAAKHVTMRRTGTEVSLHAAHACSHITSLIRSVLSAALEHVFRPSTHWARVLGAGAGPHARTPT